MWECGDPVWKPAGPGHFLWPPRRRSNSVGARSYDMGAELWMERETTTTVWEPAGGHLLWPLCGHSAIHLVCGRSRGDRAVGAEPWTIDRAQLSIWAWSLSDGALLRQCGGSTLDGAGNGRGGDPLRTAQPSIWGWSLSDGAGNRVRTGDLNLGKVALYQLSYSRRVML
jgi:hypothetical protein